MSEDCDSRAASGDEEPPQPAPAAVMFVEVVEMGGDWAAIPDVVAAVGEAAQAAAAVSDSGLAGAEAAIALADDAEVARLNQTYRGKSGPTNVLSFPAQADVIVPPGEHGGPPFIGDIVLAAQTVFSEAASLAIPPRHHLQHLVVHGLLHLAGFDHEDEREAERMESLEVRILHTLSIDDPYTGAPLRADA